MKLLTARQPPGGIAAQTAEDPKPSAKAQIFAR